MTPLDAKEAKLPRLHLTVDELADLPEYSTTYPTGVTSGKRWRRHTYSQTPERIWIGEYYIGPGTPEGHAEIRWYRPVIRVVADMVERRPWWLLVHWDRFTRLFLAEQLHKEGRL